MAFQGERDAARGAREERDAEQLFKAADALADGAGCERERGTFEAGLARDLAETLKILWRRQRLPTSRNLNDLVKIIAFGLRSQRCPE